MNKSACKKRVSHNARTPLVRSPSLLILVLIYGLACASYAASDAALHSCHHAPAASHRGIAVAPARGQSA
eukprot:6177985-Pleurochrysis_carterae.AAC.10